jgi:hypothetical protein
MRHAGIFLILGLALAGCPGQSDDGPPDVMPDAGASSDADVEPEGSGLSFQFGSDPELPGGISGENNPYVEDARFTLVQVRAIGDAATGDELTSAASFELSWGESSEEELSFPQAPPGIYSQFLAEIDSYEIQGTVEVGGVDKPFRIARESGAAIPIALSLESLVLDPGLYREVEIDVGLSEVIVAIDWEQVPEDELGWLHVGADSVYDATVHERLAQSFDLDSSDTADTGN